MLSKGKILYQVKLILDCLPKEEYNLIPEDKIKYIEDNFEYDENIKIDPSIPLEKQNINAKAYEVLDDIVKSATKNKDNKSSNITNSEEYRKYISDIKAQNKEFDVKIENIRLSNLVEVLKEENSKIPKAKKLVEEYKDALKQKDEEIESLKRKTQQLYDEYQKIPSFIRKMFVKDEIKLID